MTKSEYLSAYYFALRYEEWKSEYESLADTSKAITYSDMPKGSLNVSSPTERAAIRRAELLHKIELIEQTALEASGDLYQYLIKAVTNEDVYYHHLKTIMDIPCGKDLYYEIRRRFYYLLSKKI